MGIRFNEGFCKKYHLLPNLHIALESSLLHVWNKIVNVMIKIYFLKFFRMEAKRSRVDDRMGEDSSSEDDVSMT